MEVTELPISGKRHFRVTAHTTSSLFISECLVFLLPVSGQGVPEGVSLGYEASAVEGMSP